MMKKTLTTLLALGAVTLLFAPRAEARIRPRACGEQVADYQYASPSPSEEVLTATTYSCRTNAHWAITLHGGSWINGSRRNTQNAVDDFYSHGWQVFNVEYRRGANVTWKEQSDDLTAAYDWIASHAAQFNLDMSLGTAYGFSAGGHMAAWLGNQRPLASVVSLSGIVEPERVADDDENLRPATEPTNSGMHSLHDREVYMMSLENGGHSCDWSTEYGSSSACEPLWNAFDPDSALTSSSAALYLLEGDDDPLNTPQETDDYCSRASQVNVSCTSIHVPGYRHDSGILYDGTDASNTRDHDMRAWVLAHDPS